MVTVRCLISIAVSKSWYLYPLDVNNAFLYGDLNEDVYMSLPQRQWNAKLITSLVEHGFEQIKFDYSLYVKRKGSLFVASLVYVDDVVITGNDESEFDEFKKFLSSKFLIKELGELKYFLGIEVLRNDKAALRVLRYLKKSPGSCLHFNISSVLKLRAYADVDWAKCPKTRKSVTVFCVFLDQSLIS
ncbi:ribonuclease H-like domain-containing protein [Tanacetum coccineum]